MMISSLKHFPTPGLMHWFVLLFFVLASNLAFAEALECPARHSDIQKVNFSHSECRLVNLSDYQSPRSAVWLQFPLKISNHKLAKDKPMGLFISGNMSLRAYINGNFVGEKGTPAVANEMEITGPFDWVGYIEKHILENDNNTVTLFLSGHSNLLSNEMFFNRLYVDYYDSTTQSYAEHYAPTLITLGIMLISLFSMFRQNRITTSQPRSSRILRFLVVVAILQLFLEVARGFIAYPYPAHELRLHAILLCSFTFGQVLLIWLLKITATKKQMAIVACSVFITLLRVLTVYGLDEKAIVAFVVPAAVGLVVLSYNLVLNKYSEAKQNATRYSIAFLTLFILLTFLRGDFLDHYFFACVAILLAFIGRLENESKLKLLQSLNKSKQVETTSQPTLAIKTSDEQKRTLKIKSARELLLIQVEHIAYCKASGDYVELVCDDKTQLYSGSLGQLTKELPTDFLKVHRSYLVNTSRIRSVKRHPSGNGELSLDNGDTVPVSRTLFMQTKAALA